MGFLSVLSAVLAFRTVLTTIFITVIYVAVFSTLLITDQLPSVPKHTQGLDFQQAYRDLHEVAARPHPFNSHANVLVRSYILNRVKDIASSYDHVEGSDEEYQESGGLLLSTHWDSVSTAPGATDDGMGVVTLLSMVKYFAENRPSRTVVFNINNGEEDGLNGAHVFMEHPWVNNTDTFLNLEGAAAGGRPLLFRATSRAPLASWGTSRPHANVITGDAFSRGVIRSGTDYSVYEQAGLKGLDFAFYRGRSSDKSKNALWAMMEGTLSSSLVLANDVKGKTRTESVGRGSEPVYFDLFGVVMIVFTFQTLQIVNIILLTVGPVILLMLGHVSYSFWILSHCKWSYTPRELCGACIGENNTYFQRVWSKFWIALLLGVGFQILLVVGYAKLNPFPSRLGEHISQLPGTRWFSLAPYLRVWKAWLALGDMKTKKKSEGKGALFLVILGKPIVNTEGGTSNQDEAEYMKRNASAYLKVPAEPVKKIEEWWVKHSL
ncbi:hypothetical protein EV424DRAFT_1559462 [Suillus variegatus]|nr:hypothetical protein EV424DRAFT_1559462 [Suillus variegatus]